MNPYVTATPEQILELQRITKRNEKRRNRNRKQLRTSRAPFVGVDGEGGNLESGHEYLLLRAGYRKLATGRPLTSAECLNFIADLPLGPIYVGYFFDYDVTMILRGLRPERIDRIMRREARSPKPGFTLPVDIDELGLQVDYLPHKEFRVRRMVEGEPEPWRVINDVGSFFQCSFIKALEQWDIGTPFKRQSIAQSKILRSEFQELTDETDIYNELEIELLQDLMESFRNVCYEVGVVPARWQGPGNIASRLFHIHGIPKTNELTVPPEVVQAASAAYYGGRFDRTIVGPAPGPVYQYDINSAYPDAITKLPCLRHGEWVPEPVREMHQLSHGVFRAHETADLYDLPVRTKQGNITFPRDGRGWYWNVETDRLLHQIFVPDKTYSYVTTCDCEPFDWIPDLYAERQSLGKSARGIVLKLAMNSLYGKSAQSIGNPPYANPVMAGLITAITRAKLADLAHSGPDCCHDVWMLATDGVFCGPRDILPNKELGEWDLEVHRDGIFVIQAGLYLTSDNTAPKTRGLPRQVVIDHELDFRKAFQRFKLTGQLADSVVICPMTQFIGIRLANARHALDTAGQWVNIDRAVSFDYKPKRTGAAYNDHGIMRVDSPVGSIHTESVPYSKDIGRMLEEAKMPFWDQPDWSDILFEEKL